MNNSKLCENLNGLSQAILDCEGYFPVKLNSLWALYHEDRTKEIQWILSLLRRKDSLPIDDITLVSIGDTKISIEGILGSYPVSLDAFYTGGAEETLRNLISSKNFGSQVIIALKLLQEQEFKIVEGPRMNGNEAVIKFSSESSYNLGLVLRENSNYIKVRAKKSMTHSLGMDQVDINILTKSFLEGNISIYDEFDKVGLSWCIKKK